jgi:hypothetical protein
MQLKDIFENNNENPLQNVKHDNSRAEIDDTRKTRLTLEQINRLRLLNDVKIIEYNKEITAVKSQFKPAGEAAPV